MKPGNNSASRTKLIRTAALLISLILSLLPSLGRAQQSTAPKRVLVLYWYGKDFQGNVRFDRSFQAVLQAAPAGTVEYYPEYLESDRFPGENQSSLLHDYLRRKYADRTIDVVVATADEPLNFLLKYRKNLFPHTPIVFSVARRPTADELAVGPGLTGLIFPKTDIKTLDLALRLHPGTEQVFIVSGTLEHDKRLEMLANEELQGYKSKVLFTYLTDLTPSELIVKTKSLPERSLILYVWQQSMNRQGKVLESADVLASFAQSASAPIYGMFSHNVGGGIIGGYVYTTEVSASRIAEIALQIVNGTRAQDIPVESAQTIPMFDWRQLQRWGISEDKLPPDSDVRFRQLTFWEHYKWYIIGVLALCALQALLISILLVERAHRRRAKAALDERLRFETLLSELSAEFTNLPAPEVDRGIDQWLKRLGKFFGADAGAFLEISKDGVGASHETNMAVLGESPLAGMRDEQRRWCRSKLRSGATVNLSCVAEVPPEEVSGGKSSERTAPKSLLAIPIAANGSACALVFARGESYRDWPEDLIPRLRLAGEIFVGAVVRKKHEEALCESEERYRAFFELTAVGAGQASPQDGRLLRVNEAHCRITGHTREELLRMSFIEMTHPEDREKDVEKFRQLIRGEIAEYSNEKRYLRKDGQSVWVQVHVSLVRDSEGRPLHTVAIVQDISERKRRQEALARSEAFNRRIIQSSTDGMTILDPEGNLLYLNPAGQRLMEIHDLAACLNSPWLDFWQGAERLVAHGAMREAASGGERRFQGYCPTVKGTPRWWDVALAPMRDAEGTVERLLVVSRDITERKRAEALRAGQTQILEMIATNAPLETILGTLTSFIESQADGMLCSILLLDEDGVHMRHGAASSLPESYTKLIDGVSIGPQAGSCGTAMYRAQPVIVTDILEDPLWDDYRDLAAAHGLRACWSAPILSSQRNVLGSFGTYYREPRSPQPTESALIDLAIHIAGIAIERKRAERALRESEERLRLACEAGRMGVWDWDMATNEVVWSKDIFSILGLEPFSIQPSHNSWVERIHPDDLSQVEDTLNTAMRGNESFQTEYRIILPGGTISWVESRGRSTHNEAGDCISMKGLMIDISERKQIERALLEGEQRYHHVVETQTELICRNLPDTTLTFVNDAYCRYFKKTREQLIGVKFLELIPEPVRPEVLHRIETLIDCPDTETSEHEHEVIRPDGSVGWHHWVNRKILDSAGRVVEVQGIGRDITQRKLAENALRESEERYRNVVETQTELICRYWCDTTLTFVNDAYCRYFGKTQAQLIGTKFLELLPEEARPAALAHVDSLLANPRIETDEHQVIRADGTIGWQQWVDYAIRDVDGCIVELQAIGRDITDRKQLEENLQGLNREFSTLVENSPDVISRLDRNLRYLYISPIVERVLGVSPQQFIGKTTREIGAPPHDWDGFETSCRQALETGEIVDREFSYEGRHYHSRLIPDVGAAGSVDSVLCISEDITERRRAERELVQMSVRLLGLQDEERRRLARQLHDVTAQNLFATTINLARLQTLSLPGEVKEVLAESQGLCEQGLQEIRTLSYLLHPPLLDQAGLIPALKWYIEGFSKRSGIDVGLVVPQEIDRLTHEVEAALFRIVQESLANIHRHSGSDMADVRLEKEGTQVVLQIRDGGHGMPEVTTAEPDIATLGVGIPGMRQRLRQLGGHLNIESSAKGTTVRATVPLPAERRVRSRATGGGDG